MGQAFEITRRKIFSRSGAATRRRIRRREERVDRIYTINWMEEEKNIFSRGGAEARRRKKKIFSRSGAATRRRKRTRGRQD
jgi:hypothetical protein